MALRVAPRHGRYIRRYCTLPSARFTTLAALGVAGARASGGPALRLRLMGLAEELVEGALDQELAALVDAVFVVGV
jgi:hypothetical protein